MDLLAQPLLEQMRPALLTRCSQFEKRVGRKPHLSVILVGDDPASHTYVGEKARRAGLLGFSAKTHLFDKSVSSEFVKKLISELNNDRAVDGILVQRPLPPQFNESEVLQWVAPEKDVDVFHPLSVGLMQLGLEHFLPCTPAGIMRLLDFYQVPLSGKVACVIGRSQIVGKPIAQLLLRRDATVIQAHSKTADLSALTKKSDIIVAAIGKPNFITKSHIKEGAWLIDVGINRSSKGPGEKSKLVGDIDYASVVNYCSGITPVPGGVGPMTIQMLFENTLKAAFLREGIEA